MKTYTLIEAASIITQALDNEINAAKALPTKNIREDFVNKKMSKGSHLIGGAEAASEFIKHHFMKGNPNEPLR